ncbi:MAG: outer membrane lipid asymmetry maintenance protein MlaD [bacterium]|nr:outer membrane lipid asymmetry maintenance protein MlaD [bacterium]MDY2830107.1 outer membrane lipid asymmetry maintenance protein MlaD [Alphaproteobacteria bacterium]
MIKPNFFMYKRPVETIMGILVLAVAALFCYFAYNVSDLKVVKGYNLTAKFLKVGGLNVGSDVRINGIKIGTVVSQKLDEEDYTANVVMSIAPNIKLPDDSSAAIVADGLIGNKFIKIDPGHSDTVLKDGDNLKNTKDFKTIEDLVGEVVFMVTNNE